MTLEQIIACAAEMQDPYRDPASDDARVLWAAIGVLAQELLKHKPITVFTPSGVSAERVKRVLEPPDADASESFCSLGVPFRGSRSGE